MDKAPGGQSKQTTEATIETTAEMEGSRPSLAPPTKELRIQTILGGTTGFIQPIDFYFIRL